MSFKIEKKYNNKLIAVVSLLVFYAVVLLKYDLYYEMNDDTMIRNILSGTYSGIPSGYCYYILYPLGALLSVLYKTMPAVMWYEVFMYGSQFVCLVLILCRLLDICRNSWEKAAAIILFFCFVFAYVLEHILFMTYTVVGGMLAVTALFLFMTQTDRQNVLKNSITSLVLVVMAYCVRDKLMIMLLPFFGLAGAYLWSKEDIIFSVKNFKKYFSVLGLFAACILSVTVIHKIAYSSEEWKTFDKFCKERTTVCDYAYVPYYEYNKQFYEENRITYQQHLILLSYDFALDETIDADLMGKVADYVEGEKPGFISRAKKTLVNYRNQITQYTGERYHTLTLLGYLLLMLSITLKNKYRIIIAAIMILGTRSIIWLYLLFHGRLVDRIIHPLYWAEFILLVTIFISETINISEKTAVVKKIVSAVCVAAVCVSFSFNSMEDVNVKYNNLSSKAQTLETVQAYCVNNSENYYLLPVLSLGVLPEKVFDGMEEPLNADLLGGWYVKSPNFYKKLNNYNINNIEEALIYNDNIYIIQKSDHISEGTSYPLELFVEYYRSKGENVEVIKTDTIVDNTEVYKIEKIN